MSSSRIIQIFKSRQNILDIMKYNLSYDISKYENFSTNDIYAMTEYATLDMLLEKKDERNGQTVSKIWISYLNEEKPTNDKIDKIKDDLFIESEGDDEDDNEGAGGGDDGGDTTIRKPVLNAETDTLVIILEVEPSETILSYLKDLYNQKGIFIVPHYIKRLQFNIFKHSLVPKMRILTDAEIETMKRTYSINDVYNQLPDMSRFDPCALALCVRPRQIVEIIRESPTAITTPFYRIVI